MSQFSRTRSQNALASLIFLSRWLQAPPYLGLIVAQGVYVYHFILELFHLIGEAAHIEEKEIMLTVLGLIDVVMIANLLIMVIVGGYETFVSRLRLEGHPDEPEWLSHVNAGVLKVKLATALIGISSIHLLKTFIEIGTPGTTAQTVLWQVVVHLTFVASALLLAWTDRISSVTAVETRAKGHQQLVGLKGEEGVDPEQRFEAAKRPGRTSCYFIASAALWY